MSETADRRLHPAALLITFVRRLPEFVLGLPAVAYFVGDVSIGAAIAIAGVGFIASMVFAWLIWSRFAYGAGASEFVIESGLFARNRRAIPYERVNDVSITRPLLARLLGVAAVAIETGAGGKDEGKLEYVSLAEAGRLRDLIRLRKAGVAGEDVDAPAPEPLIFAMSVGRLLLAGLFGFSLVFLAVLGGVFENVSDWLPLEGIDAERYIEERGSRLAGRVALAWTLTAAALLILVGMVSGVVRTVVRDFGFRLTRAETGFRRQRGLFTRTDVVLPFRRVQAAIVTTGPVRRALGWRALTFQTLGGDTGEGGSHVVAPLASATECAPILAEIDLPSPPPPEAFERSSLRYAMRRALLYAGVCALGFVALLVAVAPIWPLLALALAAPILAWLQWRHHGSLLADDRMFVRNGFWRQRVTMLACARIQSLDVRRGPIQRALGLATLIVATAGASSIAPLSVVDLRLADARALRDALLARARGRWL